MPDGRYPKLQTYITWLDYTGVYLQATWGADKSLVRPKGNKLGKCQGSARFQQHRDASCHKFFFLQGKAPKEIHAILTERVSCFLPGRAKDLSAPLYFVQVDTKITE